MVSNWFKAGFLPQSEDYRITIIVLHRYIQDIYFYIDKSHYSDQFLPFTTEFRARLRIYVWTINLQINVKFRPHPLNFQLDPNPRNKALFYALLKVNDVSTIVGNLSLSFLINLVSMMKKYLNVLHILSRNHKFCNSCP